MKALLPTSPHSIRTGRLLLLGAVLAGTAHAGPPVWWFNSVTPVITPNEDPDSTNNHAVANIGQAKWMAKSALEALRTVLPAVATQIDGDLAAIVDFSVPATPDDEWRAKQHAPLLNGQLKAMAAPFYDRLYAVAPAWMAVQLQLNGTLQSGSHYPWPATSTSEKNHAIATIGQLKAAFALRLDIPPSDTADYDEDGVTDVDEETAGIPPVSADNKDVKLNVVVIPN